jgi:hypothetical protein
MFGDGAFQHLRRLSKAVRLRSTECLPFIATVFMIVDCNMPGKFGQAPLGIFIWILFLLYWTPLWVAKVHSSARPKFIAVFLALSIVCGLRLPAALGLILSHKTFEKMVSVTDRSVERPIAFYGDSSKAFRLGNYAFADYAVDKEGGIFLLTTHEEYFPLQIIPKAAGFAFKPSPKCSIFPGAWDYQLIHVIGDWYIFQIWGGN